MTRERTGIMLCYSFDRTRLEGSSRKAWDESHYHGQPKLNGERCKAFYSVEYSRWILHSSTAREIVSVPHINQQLLKHMDKSLVLDGELYNLGLTFPTIQSIVGRSKNLHPNYELIDFHVFDIINVDIQSARTCLLESLNYSHYKNIQKVKTVFCSSYADIIYYYKQFLSQGYEGIIIRKPSGEYEFKKSTNIMKLKPNKKIKMIIKSYKEELTINGIPKGQLGAIYCEGFDNFYCWVGTGFKLEQRIDLWNKREELIGKAVEIKYQEKTEKNSLAFPVFKKII